VDIDSIESSGSSLDTLLDEVQTMTEVFDAVKGIVADRFSAYSS